MSTVGPASTRLPGLDGLRALAIALVLAYHLFPGLLPGGFIGVDIFLVVSGYLITALLLQELAEAGRIRVAAFWARRARRLLPALIVMIAIVSATAALLGGDLLVGISWQLLGVATFSYNWWSIGHGASYLQQTSPELFRHTWSLAVEEQFYLLWPLLLIALLAVPGRWLRVAAPVTLAALSAVGLGVLAGDPAQDALAASAAYQSTLTHGFGLLLGAALALALNPATMFGAVHRISGRAADRWVIVGTAALVALAVTLSLDGIAAFRGGLAAAALITAALIAFLSHPDGRAAAWADSPLPRWLGERSYGLYLWHWPVLVMLGSAFPGVSPLSVEGWLLGFAALLISLSIAALSYRWIEVPIRRHGWSTLLPSPARSPRRSVLVAAGASVALVAVIVGPALAISQAPVRSEAATYIAAGQAALDRGSPAVPLRIPKSERGPSVEAALPAGDRITAIGDSVMLAAAPYLHERYPGIVIDAVVSRQMRQAPEIIRAHADAGSLRDVVVLGLGTNGSIDPQTLHDVRSIIGPERALVLVTAQAPRGWIPGVNGTLRAFADDYREVIFADWHAAITPNLSLLARDQVHPGSAGGRLYVDVVGSALDELARLPQPVDYEAYPELHRPQ